MKRTQIQLPDELYARAKRAAAAREMTLAEVVRRALEQWLQRYREDPTPASEWRPPVYDLGGTKIPLEKLRDLLFEEESSRGLYRGDQDDDALD